MNDKTTLQGYLEVCVATENRYGFRSSTLYWMIPVEIIRAYCWTTFNNNIIPQTIEVKITNNDNTHEVLCVASDFVFDAEKTRVEDSKLFWEWFHSIRKSYYQQRKLLGSKL